MFPGRYTLCLETVDLEGMMRFYEALGMDIHVFAQNSKDPDGNVVYFDTTDPELIQPGDPKALRRVLERACRQLRDVDADPACIDAIRSKVIDRFAPGAA